MGKLIAFKGLSKSIHYAWVICMLSAIMSLFSGSAQAGKKDQMYPRQINLSGNIFHFSMPEDFSKDMPADDMVEKLDITDLKKFDNPEYGNLIRRWWDIKEPGWFGKELGTVMMDISVQRVSENKAKLFHSKPYEVTDRMDFMLMLNDVFHQRYDKMNEGVKPERYHLDAYHSAFLAMSGRNLICAYRDHLANNQKWIINSFVAPRDALTVNFSIPLTKSVYLDASFTYSPNDNILPREFNEIAMSKMNKISDNFKINYAPNNKIEEVVGIDWTKSSIDELIEQHRDDVQKLFYGPDAEKALLESEKKMKEAQLKDEAELRKALKHDPL